MGHRIRLTRLMRREGCVGVLLEVAITAGIQLLPWSTVEYIAYRIAHMGFRRLGHNEPCRESGSTGQCTRPCILLQCSDGGRGDVVLEERGSQR